MRSFRLHLLLAKFFHVFRSCYLSGLRVENYLCFFVHFGRVCGPPLLNVSKTRADECSIYMLHNYSFLSHLLYYLPAMSRIRSGELPPSWRRVELDWCRCLEISSIYNTRFSCFHLKTNSFVSANTKHMAVSVCDQIIMIYRCLVNAVYV